MFSELNWLILPKIVQYNSCTMVYKALHGLAPEFIVDLFTKVSDSYSRLLRSVDNELLRVTSSKTNIFENSFTITAAKQWNELPLESRNSSSLNAFKNALKTYLLNN